MDIFVTNDGMVNKVTKTTILQTIPDRTVQYDKEWRKKKMVQWKWRFLDINNSSVVEISYKKWNSNKTKYYLNKQNKWVTRTIDPIYDKYVTEIYYYYTN